MSDELTTAVALPIHHRLRIGVRRPENWLQLVRFAAVGASGYVVNLGVFALCLHVLGIHYLVSATVAFLISLVNNFWWNRHWTFDAGHHHPLHQGARFVAVSVPAFGLQLLLLATLVGGAGVSKLPAQAISIVCATPLSFLGQKLWSFRA